MKTVLLLAGGSSNEWEVSLKSGDNVEKALLDTGCRVLRADPADPSFNLSAYSKLVNVAFIALHGAGGEDGVIQHKLGQAKIPYKTSGIKASQLCWDKWTYKKLLNKHDITTPLGIIVSKKDISNPRFKKPYVLKPIEGGSSIDTVIARSPTKDDLSLATEYLAKYKEMLLEELIEGAEITVVVLQDKVFPVIEIVPPEGQEFYYDNKYNGASQEIVPTYNIDEKHQKEARSLALKIHKLTCCVGMSRTDMMIDEAGRLHVLETNTIPGLSTESLLPKAALAVGMNMAQVVSQLI